MSDFRHSEVSEQSVTSPTRETNQVDGVLQNYLDQLLVVVTEVALDTTNVSSKTVPGTAEPVRSADLLPGILPVDEVHTATATKVINFASKPVIAPCIDDTASQRVIDPPAVATDTAISADTDLKKDADEIQEWDPYEVSPATAEAPISANAQAVHWGSAQGVECLLFRVGGLKLAIPLSQLGGVHPAKGMTVTPLFGQSDWSLGVWQSEDQKLTAVDSAKLIMPERGVSLRDSGYAYLIQLDRTPWALACEGINDTVTLKNESIKWRSDASKRPWLAGTVISEMCALLDVPSLVALLESHQHSLLR